MAWHGAASFGAAGPDDSSAILGAMKILGPGPCRGLGLPRAAALTPIVAGNYTIALTNRDNGCMLANWTVGDTAQRTSRW